MSGTKSLVKRLWVYLSTAITVKETLQGLLGIKGIVGGLCGGVAVVIDALKHVHPLVYLFSFLGAVLLGVVIANEVEGGRIKRRLLLGAPSAKGQDEHVKQLLRDYETQKSRWSDYVRLNLIGVDCSHIVEATPYVTLKMQAPNFLPVELKLVRVTKSKGRVSTYNLPSLPESVNVDVHRWDEKSFDLRLDIHGTAIPDYLKSEAAKPCPPTLQWSICGEWVVRVFEEEQVAWTQSHEMLCNSIPIIAGVKHREEANQ